MFNQNKNFNINNQVYFSLSNVVNIFNHEIEIKRKKGMRSLRLSVKHDGRIILSVGRAYPLFLIKKFLQTKQAWLEDSLVKIKNRNSLFSIQHTASEITKYKKQTKILAEERLKYFNQFYNFKYQRIAIRNQSSRWGSCSSKKNLNFNYRLALLPTELSDLVIVHELCHLQEMNHSKNFWAEVVKTMPNYKILEKNLKKV